MLEVESLTVNYGDQPALRGVDLDVSDGEVLAVLGPSGCGKSTLLRAIAGLEPPAGGRIRWDGEDLRAVPVHRRGFGFMFQDYALFPHRDVAANVAFGLRMQRRPKAEVAGAADAALRLVGLDGYGTRRVDRLSGGEQQRVALARVLCAEPRLVLLDEPLGALDRALREELLGELRVILGARTALYVTHDQGEAFAVADRVLVLRGGMVEQMGTPEELWRAPATVWVARFLGHANVVAGEVRAGLLSLPWCVVAAPVPAAEGPVSVVIHRDGLVADPDGDIAGVVVERCFLGERTTLQVRTEAGPVLEVLAVRPEAAVGDLVRLRIDPSGLVLLPPGGSEQDAAAHPAGV